MIGCVSASFSFEIGSEVGRAREESSEEEVRCERSEHENKDSEFISCLLQEWVWLQGLLAEENRSGVLIKCFVHLDSP